MKQSALLMVVAAATALGCNPKADTASPEDATKAAEEASEGEQAPEADEAEDVEDVEDAADEAEPASDGAEAPADGEASEDGE